MKRDAFMHGPQQSLDLCEKIAVDLFAGGGGTSTGYEMAVGLPPHIAVNHNDNALSMHRMNHPFTQHLVADVREVEPRQTTGGRCVGLLHLSPDCTHHSQAAGGQPRDKKLRALSWVGIHWAGQVMPDVITLENVKQILQWGPLVAKRDPATGRVITMDMITDQVTGKTGNRIADLGERVPLEKQYLIPDKRRAGQNWERFVSMLRKMGYVVEWKVLNAADFGAPTTRERLFMVARCDGNPIVWPLPSHFKTPAKGQKKWRGAYECIDWTIPTRSIFGRQKPLVDATLRRIAKGIQRYVLENADPFIVPITHHGSDRVHDIREPLRTVTTAHRGEFALASAMLAKFRGESIGTPIEDPVPTITEGGGAVRPAGAAHALGLITAHMMQANGGFNETPGHDMTRPMTTVTNTGSQQQLVTAHLLTMRNNAHGQSVNEPLTTICAGTTHHGVVECTLSPEHEEGALRVAAFLMRYYGEGGQWSDVRDPMSTITTKDRLALVTVHIQGTPYVIVDIQLRMLAPRELYRAQGFPDNYEIDHGHDGRAFPKSEQVKMCGNSVSPYPAAALFRANAPQLMIRRAA